MLRRLLTIVASALLVTTLLPAAAAGVSTTPGPVERLDTAASVAEDRSLDRGIELVHAATDLQAERAGLSPVDAAPPAHELTAREAAAAFLGPDASASLAPLDELGPRVSTALADVIVAFAALETASEASFGSADPAMLASEQAGSPLEAWQSQNLDPRPALAARAAFLDAVGDFADALATTSDHEDVEIHEPPALAIDLGAQDDTYTEDVRLLIDVGGDDTYDNNAGGNGLSFSELIPPEDASGQPAAALVDLNGADTYGDIALDLWDRRSAANGGAFGGVGVLVDDGGNDVYAAYADGVNGGAFAGVGLLLDIAGYDTYDAAGWGANGGGYPAGVGQLVDLGDADDTYTGSYEAVNGGGALGGTGLLYDAGGEDTYTATRLATNGGGFLGDGLLVDRGDGDDAYTATATSVNGGAFAGSGLLYDEGGTDVYEDEAGGSGEDHTVVPKGAAGAQLDG